MPHALVPETPDQQRVWYEYYTTYYLDCLEHFEITLDRSIIPSKEEWIASLGTNSGTSWSPVDQSQWHIKGKSDDTLKDIEKTCPPFPPAHALYGQ